MGNWGLVRGKLSDLIEGGETGSDWEGLDKKCARSGSGGTWLR